MSLISLPLNIDNRGIMIFFSMASILRNIRSLFTSTIFVVALVSILPVTAQATPRLKIDKQIFDYGEVSEGTAIEHDFQVKNVGNKVLEIRKILPSCGCTAAVVASEKIDPNETTALKVRFDTTGFRGYKVKTVRVYTNDPEASSVVLTLKGTVNPPVMLSPPQVNFGAIQKGSAQTKEVLVKSISSGTSIVSIRPRSEFIKVAQSNTEGETKLLISLDPSTPVGIFRSRVALRTNSSSAPLINLPVFAKVRGDLSLSSAAISFGLIEGPNVKAVSKSIELVNQSRKSVLLLSAKSDHPNVSAQIAEIEKGKKYKINVTVSGNIVGALRAKIAITTDHEDPEQKKLILPVYGIVSRPSN